MKKKKKITTVFNHNQKVNKNVGIMPVIKSNRNTVNRYFMIFINAFYELIVGLGFQFAIQFVKHR
jgi:hypothetical protein